MTTKLTKLEREILMHRLEAPDCLADALEEPLEAVESAIESLPADFSPSSDLQRRVLIDAVEGSTYYGAAGGESAQKQSAIYRAGCSLARKIGEMAGREGVRFPCC